MKAAATWSLGGTAGARRALGRGPWLAVLQSRRPVSSLSSLLGYRRPTPPTGVPLSKLLLNAFPLSLRQLVRDFGARRRLLQAQHALFATLPFYPEPAPLGQHARVVATPVTLPNGQAATMNLVRIDPPGGSNADTRHVVLFHGYGAGIGFFVHNLPGIAEYAGAHNWCVHAVDWMGYGCLLRPPFPAPSRHNVLPGAWQSAVEAVDPPDPTEAQLHQVEHWFHSTLQQWMAAQGITDPSRTLLVAHSLGAYLVASYVAKLRVPVCRSVVMVSPAGVVAHRQPPVPLWFAYLWRHNILPFVLARAGPLGLLFVSGWLSRRFARLANQGALHDYAYRIFAAPGLGEYALNYVLAPGARPRFPLVERVRQWGSTLAANRWVWMYGKDDWMERLGGTVCTAAIEAHGGTSRVVEIADAGHHVFMDNVAGFNAEVVREMEQWEAPQDAAGGFNKIH